MRRNPAGRLAVVALGLLAVVATARGVVAQEKPASDENWKPEKLTNLKVLPKDTTPDQIMTIMKGYAESLNVGCVACHKGKVDAPLSTFDFADDGKENKDVTRSMIAMTRDINTKYPEGLPNASEKEPGVTCATCHRRNRHPETDLPPKPAGAGAKPAAAAKGF
jgi:Photosynthetic reaction centre cytochrome C subunit